MISEKSEMPVVRPGWCAILQGEAVDLDDWCHALNDPFDPVAEKLPNGQTVLRSRDFEGLADAEAVRARALLLIGRMNGALAVWNGAKAVRFGGAMRIDEEGKQHTTIFAEGLAIVAGRAVVRGVAQVLGPDGKPLPPPPPTPSNPQAWNTLADNDDNLSDLLEQFGRADNWYDIYKALEIAAHFVGGKHRLRQLLGDRAAEYRNLDQTANFYRHARGATLPERPTTMAEAKALLITIVREVFETQVGEKVE